MPDATAGMSFLSRFPSSSVVTIGVATGENEPSPGPEPLELLLVSLGSCTGLDVISILRKKRQVVTAYTINVLANRAKEHPQVYTEIVVEHVIEGPSVNPDAVARSLELSITKYCPVHALLSKAVPIEHVFRILDSASSSPELDMVSG